MGNAIILSAVCLNILCNWMYWRNVTALERRISTSNRELLDELVRCRVGPYR